MIDPREFARTLASGLGGNEHSPIAAAKIIEQLARDNEILTARVAELEHLVWSERVQGHLRDAYARGFRACQQGLAQQVPPGSVAEQQIMSVQPDFTKASQIAQEVAA